MDPITICALITSGIPFLTAAVKRFTTKKMAKTPDKTKAGINAVIPLVLGILSTGLYTYSQTNDVLAAIAAGLASGGVASSVRDIDKNLTGIVESLYRIAGKNGK